MALCDMADLDQQRTGLFWMPTTRLRRAELGRLVCSCLISSVSYLDKTDADPLVAMAFATQGLMTVASRIVMSTARDGLYGPVSPHLARVHPRLAVSTTSSDRLGC
jgi:hypothetical protein